MENKQKVRIIITVVLFFIITVATIYVISNKDKLFTVRYELTYPDKCVEVYENDILISDECTMGRLLYEDMKNQTSKQPTFSSEWNLNLT